MNVTLIGMAGAGKSFVGKQLAERYRFDFVDNDILLAEAHDKDIQSILDEVGEERYMKKEGEVCVAATKGRDNLLLSPAGSVIYNPTWLKHMSDNSVVVYLKVPFEVIEERLSKVPPRAIIGFGKKTLRELYDERHPMYEACADLTIDTHGRESDQVAQMVLNFIRPPRRKGMPV